MLPRLLLRGLVRSDAAICQRRLATFPAWLPETQGAQSRISTPLTQALPGVLNVPAYQASAEPPRTEVTVLSNGVRIISEATPGPTASMGIYVNSGSIYESPQYSGCSALLECLAFKSTRHRSSMRIMTEVEKIGSHIMANASREQMSYTIDCLKTHTPLALELLCDSVLNPVFNPEEVDEQKSRLLALLSGKDVQLTLLNEMLVRNAYKGALGNPLIPEAAQLLRLSPADLHSFLDHSFTGPRLILAASGVQHAQLVDLVTPMLEQVPTAASTPEPASEYQGAYVHLPGPHPQPNLLLAFEYHGGWRDVKGAVAMTVLTYLMGGGNSFSSGGPGKGMHSRLYTRVLTRYAWAHSCTAFNSTCNESGLVGIQASCEPNHVTDMLHVMCTELEAVARSVGEVEVERAKRAAISVISNALESKATSSEDIGRQFLTYGHRISGREYVEMINALTGAELSAFVANLLKSKPSLAVYGDNAEAASYDAVLARYGHPVPVDSRGTMQQRSAASRLRQALGFGTWANAK